MNFTEYWQWLLTTPKLTAPNGPQGLFCMGQIESKYPDYDHGYFEITAKLVDPGYYENGQPNLSGIWPSFWMYYLTCATCACYHDEMDVLDNLYGDNIYVINGPPVSPSEDTKYANGGTVGRIPTNPDPNFHDCVDLVDPYYHKNDNPLFESEHTYGIEWLSNKALIYFDGNLVGTSVEALPLHTLYVLMGMQFVKGYFNYNIPLPQEYQIDYFRYYQLITNYCQTDAFITSNVELNNFVYGVRRNITIGDPLTSIYLTIGQVKTFRATDNITINGDFFVPIGAELNLIPTACN